ncbi:MAG: S8 family serine peptidase [Ferruginibacter sp.]
MNNGGNITCPLCTDKVDKLLYRFHVESERKVIAKIKEQNPGWTENDGICSRCVDYYNTAILMEKGVFPSIGPHFSVKSADDFIILPTALRLDADPGYTGKGVTICFIDSGFYLHPDLVSYENRVKKIVDINSPMNPREYFSTPHQESWHGTMTTVVCAGDGYISNGLYKGIASDAELVLLKVQNESGKIPTENIVKALQWVLENHILYNIKIVNMSLGDDEDLSLRSSRVDQLAEKLIAKGIIVVAAVGNDEYGSIKPPANALNVIAVGGVDDDNLLGSVAGKLYHSSFGKTMDALMKPELMAHAIWIAAPILPGTKEQEEAEALYKLVNTPDYELKPALAEIVNKIILDACVLERDDVSFIRDAVKQRIQAAKYISANYMHVDGTSFAAPIVSSIIAQLLEANPNLTPAYIRELLFSTARRIDGIPAEKQGFGVIQARKALLKVLKREPVMKEHPSPFINFSKKTIEFYIQNDCAAQIALAGNFNEWAKCELLMEPGRNGIWKIGIPLLPPGLYQYKFYIDESRWMEDVDNPYREPDGFSGFNSILVID